MSHSAVAAHATTVPAPRNFRAVANPDDSVDTSWDAVPGDGVRYTLKEAKNPDGLSNARNITATSSHRTPPVPDQGTVTYDYWVVAVKDGVESAESDHMPVTLPHSAGGSGSQKQPKQGTDHPPSGGSPGEILQIGGAGGHWNIGIGVLPSGGGDGEILTKKNDELRNGFSLDPYFMTADGGTRVHFQAFMTGGRRQTDGQGHGSKFRRSELRELKADGSTNAWDASAGRHVLSGRTAVLHLPPKKRVVCVAQIHGTVSDTLELRVEGPDGQATDGFSWRVDLSDGNQHENPAQFTVKDGYRLGDEVAWEIRAENGTVTVTIDGQEKLRKPLSINGQYFKTGCYAQSNHEDQGNPPLEFAACTLRDLRLSHS